MEERLFTADEPLCPGGPCPDEPSIFALELHYEDGNEDLGAPNQYNGNISWMEWRVSNEPYQAYGYVYDDIYRLLEANYDATSGSACVEIPRGAYSTAYTYDDRGNIRTINRNGLVGYVDDEETEPLYEEIDQLVLNYALNTNILTSVDEGSDKDIGYLQNAATTQYTYSGGNLVGSPNVDVVEYNHLNLPTWIKSPTGSIKITYDANGSKLSQTEQTPLSPDPTTPGPVAGIPQKTVYKDGFEYVNDERVAFYHAEGRITYNTTLETGEGEVTRDVAEWNIVDHLGNTRLRYIDKDGDETINLDSEDLAVHELTGSYHYYPFGMLMEEEQR